MTVLHSRARTAVLSGCGSMLLALSVAHGEAPAAGDLWEVISLKSTRGSTERMAPQKEKVCAAKQWKSPPAGAEASRGCVSSHFEMKGTKATWTAVCKGPPEMTAKGEIYRDSANDYSGTIQYSSKEGDVVVSLSGKRIGDCDSPQ